MILECTDEDLYSVLPQNKDLYCARELTHLLTGTPYEKLHRGDILGTAAVLRSQGFLQHGLPAILWRGACGGSELFTMMYALRNVDYYFAPLRNGRRAALKQRAREHLRQFPLPGASAEQLRNRKAKRDAADGVTFAGNKFGECNGECNE